MHLSELLGKLHAAHRKAGIDRQARVADLARRIVAKRWPQVTPDQWGEHEREERRRVARHFARQVPGANAWGLAVAELTKFSPARLESYPLAEYVGLVNAGVGLDCLPDHLAEVAALVAGLDAILMPALLVRLAADFPAVIETLGVEVTARTMQHVEAGNVASTVQQAPSELDILSIAEAADVAGVSARTIKRLIKNKRLNASEYGTGKRKNHKIKRADLTAVAGEAKAVEARAAMPPPRSRRRPTASLAADFLPRV